LILVAEDLPIVVIHEVLAEFLLGREGPAAYVTGTDLAVSALDLSLRH
jgi:hypothetical protein